jgi:hypothetical protein
MYRSKHVRAYKRPWTALVAITAMIGAVGIQAAFASHPEVSLDGSEFEIDTDANLRVDDIAPSIDWANVTEIRAQDSPTGASDESFGQGTKENTADPTVVDGSIPPNKSDLKFFGLYQEGDEFLHLFWSRVQDPEGTTNMDFELNKNKCDPDDLANSVCATNGVTPARSVGDILITYDLSRGGTVPTIKSREWTGTQWGPELDLTADGDAAGSINTSLIPAAESDGLGEHSPRTFGEASLRLDAISDPDSCLSFGSAYLKSRASDSFTAALKDFVPPEPVSIGGACGAIKVTKVRKHAALGTGNHPHSGVTFTLMQGTTEIDTEVTNASGVACFDEVLFGNYTVVETVPSNYSSSSASTNVTVDNQASCTAATFVGEEVNVTNTPLSDITVSFSSLVTGGTAATIDCTGLTATPPDGTPAAFDDTSETFEDLEPGTYTCTVVIDP